MGLVSAPKDVKLIAGLLAADAGSLERARSILGGIYGPQDLESGALDFEFTEYYNEEMGEKILRQYISFGRLISPDALAGIKLDTNRIEAELAVSGKRKVNIDPGYLDLSKMVLATTKDSTYRVYLGRGIYAQSTLYFKDKSYRPWPWTYPDYQAPETIEFFNKARKIYKEALAGM